MSSARALPAVPSEMVGRRVRLRALVAADFESWTEVRDRCRDWLVKWEPQSTPGRPDPPSTKHVFAARCSARDREWQIGSGYGFGIFVDALGPDAPSARGSAARFAGEINLSSVQRGPYQNAYVGYWIDEALAGMGYMPEAVVLVARFAFESLALHRIQVSVIPRNEASRRVAEKVGLRDEGIAERYLQIGGRWEDHVRYALTAEDWEDRRAELLRQWVD